MDLLRDWKCLVCLAVMLLMPCHCHGQAEEEGRQPGLCPSTVPRVCVDLQEKVPVALKQRQSAGQANAGPG